MEDIALHILDIAENSLRGGAGRITIRVTEDIGAALVTIEITDDGDGMTEDSVSRSLDPFFTSKRGKRTGLGLPLFAQAAGETGGEIEITSVPGEGTTVKATFRTDHPDMKPMGDIEGTVALLRAFNRDRTFEYSHIRVNPDIPPIAEDTR